MGAARKEHCVHMPLERLCGLDDQVVDTKPSPGTLNKAGRLLIFNKVEVSLVAEGPFSSLQVSAEQVQRKAKLSCNEMCIDFIRWSFFFKIRSTKPAL